MKTKPSVLVIIGPTGVGKSELAYQVIPEIIPNGHIINADSQQVYRGLDIGTAKPTAAERELLPHHLFDICDPDQQFSAGEFKKAAETLIHSIVSQGDVPIILGGTGFYIKHLLYHFHNPPPSDQAVRDSLEQECDLVGLPTMREKLRAIDPKSYQEISENDRYRIIRALEIFQISGKPRTFFAQSLHPRQDWNWKLVCLNRPREELYSRINRRVNAMISLGLLDEIRGLLSQGWTFQDPGMQAIGYKEFAPIFANLDVSVHESSEVTLDFQWIDVLLTEVKQHTRNYAKRQLTFFRSFKEALWLEGPTTDTFTQALELSLTET